MERRRRTVKSVTHLARITLLNSQVYPTLTLVNMKYLALRALLGLDSNQSPASPFDERRSRGAGVSDLQTLSTVMDGITTSLVKPDSTIRMQKSHLHLHLCRS